MDSYRSSPETCWNPPFVVISETLVEKGNEFDSVELSCDEEGLSDLSNSSSRNAGTYTGYRKLLRNAFWQQRLGQSGSEVTENFGACGRQ
jgi:hypothetical protein